jgi:phospholipid-binding lipoprotein MlaA
MAGDAFLNPVNYLSETEYILSVKALETVNEASLTLGEYEDLKRAALDPYVSLRDAYFQHRRSLINK